MRVRALGIRKAHNAQMLGMRMSFVRPPGAVQVAPGTQEFVVPSEQLVRIGEREIKPAFVHSKIKKAHRVFEWVLFHDFRAPAACT